MEREIKFQLKKIANKIAKIEENNPSYKHDKNWLDLRAKQDYLYDLLAKEKLKRLENSTLNYYKQRELNKVKDYLGDKNGNEKENNSIRNI